MNEDEDRAKRIASYTIGQELAELSVDEISETIQALQDEIIRLQTVKSEKTDHLSEAEALFRS